MPRLHYASALDIDIDPETSRQVIATIGAHATRGGWVEFVDRNQTSWSILITPGVPVWVEGEQDGRMGR